MGQGEQADQCNIVATFPAGAGVPRANADPLLDQPPLAGHLPAPAVARGEGQERLVRQARVPG